MAADYSPKRRQLAEAMGAHQTVDPAQHSPFHGTTPAMVFEAVGAPGIIDNVLQWAPGRNTRGHRWRLLAARHGARVLRDRQRDPPAFVFAYDPMEFVESLRTIAEGEIDVAPVITKEVSRTGRRRVR